MFYGLVSCMRHTLRIVYMFPHINTQHNDHIDRMRHIHCLRIRTIMCVGITRIIMIRTSIRSTNSTVTIIIITRSDGIRGDRIRVSCIIIMIRSIRVINHMRIHIRES